MYKFHYDDVLKTFDAKLLFIDADGLVYEINSSSVYEQCFKNRKLFDFSGYLLILTIMTVQTKKVLGKM